MTSSLDGLVVLDLSRVLAGPVCTQILGDLGATIIKVEKPGEGDDTRRWGPPYLKDKDGHDTNESSYYLCCNRNKKSVTVDISTPDGQKIICDLAAKSDILIHNFKVGGLEKYGLGFDTLHKLYPRLIYTAISGFGQTGPLSQEPGYDLMAQAMGGIMAHSGPVDGEPTKTSIAIVDIMTGLYAAIGTLAALNSRNQTGLGQLVDVALLDVTLASMTNIAQYFLTSGLAPKRYGNAHPTIVPYQSFEASDGHMVIAVGNDPQFVRLCNALGHPEWANDLRFAHNDKRVEHRDALVALLSNILKQNPINHWIKIFQDIDVPAAPVNSIDKVFDIDQIHHRGMEIKMPHPSAPSDISLVGSPLKLSNTPVSYRIPPPLMGADTDDVLAEMLGMGAAELNELRDKKII